MAAAPDQPVTTVFGARVRARRTELGWTLEKLAEVSDLHWTYLSGVERGARNLGLENVVRVATALQIDPAELVRGLTLRGKRPPRKSA